MDPRAFRIGGAGAEIGEQVGRFQERARYAVRGCIGSYCAQRTAHHSRLTPADPQGMLDPGMSPAAAASRAPPIPIETDPRLGPAWDEWGGKPPPRGGGFSAP